MLKVLNSNMELHTQYNGNVIYLKQKLSYVIYVLHRRESMTLHIT